jgi:hypothetical protein
MAVKLIFIYKPQWFGEKKFAAYSAAGYPLPEPAPHVNKLFNIAVIPPQGGPSRAPLLRLA